MAVLTQFFCKMYSLYVSRSQKKNLGNFFLVLPPEKAVFFGGGQISRNSVRAPNFWKSGKSRTPYKKRLFSVGKRKKMLPKFFCGFGIHIKNTFCKKIGSKRPFQPSAVVRAIYTRLYGVATAN